MGFRRPTRLSCESKFYGDCKYVQLLLINHILYHPKHAALKATHELFFSTQSLYVLVWDMGVSRELSFVSLFVPMYK